MLACGGRLRVVGTFEKKEFGVKPSWTPSASSSRNCSDAADTSTASLGSDHQLVTPIPLRALGFKVLVLVGALA